MSRLRTFPRPERFVIPIAMAITLLLAWAAVAHASGSGWVQAIGAIAAGIVFVGMICPAAAAVRLQARCVACPRDATTNQPIEIEILGNAPLKCTPLRPRGRAAIVPFGEPCVVSLTPPTRGVITGVRVRLATAAPFGLLWWSTERLVPLPQPVYVAPDIGDGEVAATASELEDEGKGQPVPHFSGSLRGVREYSHGDSPRLVHWRATAHTGSLMVRENEQEPDLPVKVVADLPDDAASAEVAAGRALGSVVVLLERGRHVVLETTQGGRRLASPVTDRRGAGRRLAQAGRNPYADLDQLSVATDPLASGAAPAVGQGR